MFLLNQNCHIKQPLDMIYKLVLTHYLPNHDMVNLLTQLHPLVLHNFMEGICLPGDL